MVNFVWVCFLVSDVIAIVCIVQCVSEWTKAEREPEGGGRLLFLLLLLLLSYC